MADRALDPALHRLEKRGWIVIGLLLAFLVCACGSSAASQPVESILSQIELAVTATLSAQRTASAQEKIVTLPKDDGYRGIWYMNQPVKGPYAYKYSGGFATYPQQHVPIAGLALILGGAIGNLLDRIMHGYVLDFVDVYYRDVHFWAFNVADAAITIGAILVLFEVLFSGHHHAPPAV